MKKPLIALLTASVLSLAACQSSDSTTSASAEASTAAGSSSDNPLVAATETRLVTAAQQALVAGMPVDKASTDVQVQALKTWYSSELPDAVKLFPEVEKVFKLHQLVLRERAESLARVEKQAGMSATDKQQLVAKYDERVAASSANLAQLTTLATTNGGGLAPADLQTQLASLVAKQVSEARIAAAVTSDAQKRLGEAARQNMMNGLNAH